MTNQLIRSCLPLRPPISKSQSWVLLVTGYGLLGQQDVVLKYHELPTTATFSESEICHLKNSEKKCSFLSDLTHLSKMKTKKKQKQTFMDLTHEL